MRRPALHGLVAVLQLPVLWLLAHGQGALVILLLGAVAGTALAVVSLRHRRYLRQRTAAAAAQQHAERVLNQIYDDWVAAEALRGQRDLERWRRTHRM